MAGKPAVQVRGAKELRRAMKVAGDDLKDWTAVNKRAAEPVKDAAQRLVPVLSGDLRDTITSRAGKASARVTAGSSVVPYAGPIHFGWPAHSIEPNPFLWNAADDAEAKVVDVYSQEVEALVRKIDRMTPD